MLPGTSQEAVCGTGETALLQRHAVLDALPVVNVLLQYCMSNPQRPEVCTKAGRILKWSQKTHTHYRVYLKGGITRLKIPFQSLYKRRGSSLILKTELEPNSVIDAIGPIQCFFFGFQIGLFYGENKKKQSHIFHVYNWHFWR